MIFAISAGRQTSPELRARLALDRPGIARLLGAPRPELRELLALSTCHRTELYAVGETSDTDALHAAASLLPDLRPADQTELTVLRGSDAVRHAYRVASGLDSLVVGEPQILGQVRDALTTARTSGAAGSVLTSMFNRAIRLGRRIRRETALGSISSSLGALAAGHLAARLGALEGRHGVVVGSGQAAGDAARGLHRFGAKLVILGRSPEPAQQLAREVGAQALGLDAVGPVLDESDFAVVAINGGDLAGATSFPPRTGRAPLALVDLSVPPAVHVTGRTDIDLWTIDELTPPAQAGLPAAVDEGGRMVEDAVDAWESWVDGRAAGHDVGRFRMQFENRVRAELTRSIARMNLSAAEAERVAALSMRIAGKLMHGPTVALRDGDEQTRALVYRIFGMEDALLADKEATP